MTSADGSVPQPASGLPDGSEPSLPARADGMQVEGTPAGSPVVRLTHLINAWHRSALASQRLQPAGTRRLLAMAGFITDEEHEVGEQGIPATGGERCERCGRRLQFIHRVNGRNFGRICATKGVT